MQASWGNSCLVRWPLSCLRNIALSCNQIITCGVDIYVAQLAVLPCLTPQPLKYFDCPVDFVAMCNVLQKICHGSAVHVGKAGLNDRHCRLVAL